MSEAAVPASAARDREALEASMQRQGLLPLWKIYQNVVTREPAAGIPSVHWRWKDLQEAVDLSVRAVTGHDADHRVLVLKNPHIASGAATTHNILAAVQCVLPGERTSPHRHTPAAVRLVLDGHGGGTYVDGVRCAMHSGDFIVTPNWTWHCHDNDSSRPVTWVDILDVPLVRSANAMFGESGPVETFPETLGTLPDALFERGGITPVSDRPAGGHTPRFRYAWSDVANVLSAMSPDADGSKTVRYTNLLDGGPVVPTLDARVLEINAGRTTAAHRSTASRLAVVIEGRGTSRIGGLTHEWGPRDIFTIPEWNTVTHSAIDAAARILLVSDEHHRRLLGLYREER